MLLKHYSLVTITGKIEYIVLGNKKKIILFFSKQLFFSEKYVLKIGKRKKMILKLREIMRQGNALEII